jgi:excisionase family DNA binding protein
MSVEPLSVRRKTAASMLGIGTTKLDELIGAGQIAAVKSGKVLLIPVAGLKQYLASLPAAKLAPPRKRQR